MLETKTTDELTTREILEQGFAKYREELVRGDQAIIAEKSEEPLRTVRECISNKKVGNIESALKIFKAMKTLITDRRTEAQKLVA